MPRWHLTCCTTVAGIDCIVDACYVTLHVYSCLSDTGRRLSALSPLSTGPKGALKAKNADYFSLTGELDVRFLKQFCPTGRLAEGCTDTAP